MFARFNPANQDPTQPGQTRTTRITTPLQIAVNRRFARGFQIGASYTWSKTLGVADGDTSGISPYFSPRFRNYGPLAFDRPHVTSMMSGAPFTPGLGWTMSTDVTGSTEGARVNIVGDPYSGETKTFYHWFNQAAIAPPPIAAGTVASFGNAGQNILRNPGTNNWYLDQRAIPAVRRVQVCAVPHGAVQCLESHAVLRPGHRNQLQPGDGRADQFEHRCCERHARSAADPVVFTCGVLAAAEAN